TTLSRGLLRQSATASISTRRPSVFPKTMTCPNTAAPSRFRDGRSCSPRTRETDPNGLPLPTEAEERRARTDLVAQVLRERPAGAGEHRRRRRHGDGTVGGAPVPEEARGFRGHWRADPAAR